MKCNMVGLVNQSNKAVVAGTRVKDRCRDEPRIQALGLTKVFGRRVAVDKLNLSVYEGELYALLGENGAGKTTTLNMLTTLLAPTKGEFFICGHHGTRDPEKAKGAFGIVSQDVAVYQELTARENLSFIASLYEIPPPVARARIDMLLSKAGLIERANDRAGEFSSGMLRKLSIACALIHQPRVLFMDEPTVGLDPGSRRQIWSILKELCQEGVSILLTTHYLEEAELLADRIGIIRLGQLVTEGTIDELRVKIQGIRSIAIRLVDDINMDVLQPKLDKLSHRFATQARYDPLRRTLSFTQPHDSSLLSCLREILCWLESEKISFSKFSTGEPNLEEVFLALSVGPANIQPDKPSESDPESEY